MRSYKMKELKFKANYKTYKLYYTDKQKEKIDHMKDWKNTIKRLQHAIKNNYIKENGANVSTHYISSYLNNYSFYIVHISDNQFIIKDRLES